MSQVGDDVGLAKHLAPRALERIGCRVRCVPLRDDVVIGYVFQTVPDRNEIRYFRIPRASLAMDRVEEAVLRKFRVKDKADEAAFQPVIDQVGEGGGDIRVHMGLIVRVDQIQQSSRVVGEAAAIGEIAYVTHTSPSSGLNVLIGGMKFARIEQAHEVFDLHGEPALHNGFRNGVAGNRRIRRADRPNGEKRDNAEQDPNTHKPSRYSILGSDHTRSAVACSVPLRVLRCSSKSTLTMPLLSLYRLVAVSSEHGNGRIPSYRESLPAQPVDATPSAINLFSKGGVHDASETGKAFREPADRHVELLEGGTVIA